MSKLPETMYDYRPEREVLRAVDICSDCGYDIYFGQEYYDIHGKIFCEDCMSEHKKIGGEDE